MKKIEKLLELVRINEVLYTVKADVFSKLAKQKAKIDLPISASDEKEAERKFRDSIKLHIKNGHLPKDTVVLNIKIS